MKYPIEDITRLTHTTVGSGASAEHIIKFKMNDGKVVDIHPVGFDEDATDITIRPMPLEVSDLNDEFPILYPEAETKLYYDELRERVMVDTSLFGMAPGVKPLSDVILAHYHDNIERRFDEENYMGQSSPSYTIRDEALLMQATLHKRNPFLEWVQSHTWDGKPRVRTWFIDLVGATAPPLATLSGEKGEECERLYLESVTEAWFVGAISRQFKPTKVEIVPVLISGQGIGKGNSLRYTAGMDEWFIDTNADIKRPDRFLDSVRGRVIVELSESTQLRGPDAEALKAFISQEEDQLRKAYAHNEEIYPRHFVMIASSNLDNIFTDVTGNRRYFPFYCDPRKATRTIYLDREDEEGQYEVEQLWAEALYLYENGHPHHITPDIANLADIMQQYSSVENPGVEAIDAVLDQIHPDVGDYTSRQEILSEVFSIPPGAPCPKEYDNNYRAWANGTKAWKKVNTNKRINGRVTKGYMRVVAPGEAPKVERLKMKRTPRKNIGEDPCVNDTTKQWFRNVLIKNRIKSTEEFCMDGAPSTSLAYLESIGLIYRVDTRDGKPIYRTILGYDSPAEAWKSYKGISRSESDEIADDF